jgi:hypothetical protein
MDERECSLPLTNESFEVRPTACGKEAYDESMDVVGSGVGMVHESCLAEGAIVCRRSPLGRHVLQRIVWLDLGGA